MKLSMTNKHAIVICTKWLTVCKPTEPSYITVVYKNISYDQLANVSLLKILQILTYTQSLRLFLNVTIFVWKWKNYNSKRNQKAREALFSGRLYEGAHGNICIHSTVIVAITMLLYNGICSPTEGLQLYGINVYRDLVARCARIQRQYLPTTQVSNMQLQLMKLSQAVTVADTQNCYLQLGAGWIQVSLHCQAHLACCLVQDCNVNDNYTQQMTANDKDKTRQPS